MIYDYNVNLAFNIFFCVLVIDSVQEISTALIG